MISRIFGTLLAKNALDLLIDVQGVGYELQVSMQTMYQLPAINERVTLYTHLVVREDAHTLYGFSTLEERSLFRHLIKANGVGPKMALSILSSKTVNDFVLAIHQQDANSLVKIPGIGKKTAERLLIEMRDRLKEWAMPESSFATETENANGLSSEPSLLKIEKEAISALVTLGYKPQEASRAISRVSGNVTSVEQLIKTALQHF